MIPQRLTVHLISAPVAKNPVKMMILWKDSNIVDSAGMDALILLPGRR